MNNAETKQILDDFGVKNYTINDDLTVDVVGNVEISGKGLTKIPIKFGKVTGDFRCEHNNLTTLEGSPENVGRHFWCHSNNLTTLEGSPDKVGGSFWCYNNKLTSLEGSPKEVGGAFDCQRNNLTTLEGSPEIVGGSFYCDNNNLTTLKGSPQKVEGTFWCYNNNLTSLEGSPKKVGGDFRCNHNNLTTLEGSPDIVGGYFYCHNNPLPSNIKNPEYPNITRYELEKNHLIWQNGKYRVFDNIFCEVLSQKDNVYKVKIKGKVAYVIDNGICFSHGETIEKARENLIYKISDRDTSKYKGMNLATVLTKAEAIQMYRTITGACEYGVKNFVEGLKEVKEQYTIQEVIDLTAGQYENDTLKEFFKRGKR